MASSRAWQAGLATSFGATAILAACALVAGWAALGVRTTRIARGLSLFGILAAGVALALSGHGNSAAPQWLTRPAVLVHIIAVTVWIGALVPLAAIMLRGPAPEDVLSRFSRSIPWAIAALVVSGAVLAVVQVLRSRPSGSGAGEHRHHDRRLQRARCPGTALDAGERLGRHRGDLQAGDQRQRRDLADRAASAPVRRSLERRSRDPDQRFREGNAARAGRHPRSVAALWAMFCSGCAQA
uniref:Putative copper export protein-like protein n=1 Tax=Rhodopseudomonas palustris (strain BisA53) TaxID=316055 RepID=Q07Q66_RHOP5